MKNAFFCNNVAIYIIISFILFPIFATIIALTLTKQFNILFILIIPVVFSIILFIFRKIFFAKIEISNDGISKIYGKKTIKTIKWGNLYSVKTLPGYNLIFLDKEMDKTNILNNYKSNVSFLVNNKNIIILSRYTQYFKNKITDISLLSKYHQNLLLQK